MQIETKRIGEITLIKVTGRVDGESSPRFDWICQEAIGSGSHNLIIDTAGMNYVSSLGLRSFLSAAKSLEPKGGKVLISGLHGLPRQVFEIAHLLEIFPTYETPDDAIGSLAPRQSRWLTLAATPTSLNAFSKFVHEGAAEARIPEIDQEKLDLILEELLTNVATYAYPTGVGSVEIGYTVLEPGRLKIEMCDTGVPFNPLEAQPSKPEGGLGLLLVKSLSHNLRYDRDPYRNVLTFELRVANAAGA